MATLFDWGGTSNYTLEVIYPRAIGAAGTGLDADNRCYFAHTGVDYEIQVGAIGGVYPYRYTLSNAPDGMTVGELTGAITWTNPQSTATDVTVTVTDTKGTTATATWTITVGTSGWFFVDAVSGSDANSGTLASPWQTLSKVYDSSTANSRVYFRSGTYTPAGITTEQADNINGEEKITWSNASRSVMWLAYPGESPVIDFGYTGSGYPYNTGDSVPRFLFVGDVCYIDGFETDRSMTVAFEFSRSNRRGAVIRRCTMHDTGPGINGGNSAFILFGQTYGGGGIPDTQVYFDMVYGCSFDDIQYGTGNCAIKMYSCLKSLIANNTMLDETGSPSGSGSEVLAIKSDNSQYTVRGNTLNGTGVNLGIGGNMHAVTDPTYGEICFNYVYVPQTATSGNGALHVNQDGTAEATYIYRNTIRGRITLENIDEAEDGPFQFTRNVIINSDSSQTPWAHIVDTAVTDTTRVTAVMSGTPTSSENLAGVEASSIVDASGLLTGSYRTNYLGSWGHETITVSDAVSAGTHPALLIGVL